MARGERYALLPDEVLTAPAVVSLPPAAFRVLVTLTAQYNGHNNGRLSLPLSAARGYGVRSADTLHRALNELINRGLIERMHQGGLGLGCSRYSLAWRDLDPEPHGSCVLPTPATHAYLKWAPDASTPRRFK